MKPTTIAVDIAKDVFQIAVSIHPGKVAESHRLRRDAFLEFFVNRPVSTVVMEACGTAPCPQSINATARRTPRMVSSSSALV
jgi:transposase